MQGGPGPGRGIYVTRRVLAALVVLLLLVLLVPWACQNLIGSREQPGSESSETADVDSSDEGAEEAAKDEEVNTNEEAATDEEAVTDEDSGAERADTVRGSDSETGSEDDEEGFGDEEDGGASEVELDPLGSVAGFEAVGGAGQIPPTLDLGAANQLAIQPVAPTEPVFLALPPAPAESLVPVEPIIPAEPPLFEDPSLFGDPFPFEGAACFEDPFLCEDPFLFGGAVYFEEPPVALEEPPVSFEEFEESPVADYAGPIATTSATSVEVERRGDGGRRGKDRLDVDRGGGGDDGRDLGPD
jgi:hypothetical protein